jgi:antitoxin component of MazEF toxin-antitoxin module
MKRKLVQAGSSLAVTLPADLVHDLKLEKGMTVDVSVHPQTGAVTIRPGVKLFEEGKASKRFIEEMEAMGEVYAQAFDELAK